LGETDGDFEEDFFVPLPFDFFLLGVIDVYAVYVFIFFFDL